MKISLISFLPIMKTYANTFAWINFQLENFRRSPRDVYHFHEWNSHYLLHEKALNMSWFKNFLFTTWLNSKRSRSFRLMLFCHISFPSDQIQRSAEWLQYKHCVYNERSQIILRKIPWLIWVLQLHLIYLETNRDIK